ncbi:hypothetical protein DAH72_01140 [Sphingomonas koreensis]|nr:hypothetical protein DAH94_01655 [Sphingomonas koreensis]RSY76916.1 hypothetical protein DAH72_01140 [Sphingomonas koreensis]RSZ00374.1 hypothetical protein DAH62_02600 [Sphingomonas koreensis]
MGVVSYERRIRALCFGRPVGPWRRCPRQARDDLVGLRLGEYDEYGRFFVIVPGDLEYVYARSAELTGDAFRSTPRAPRYGTGPAR